ncbi:hypothetical protein [Mangrovihabitans endophyticus]|nr:hypothetical protein [Mangrovihabitans endophyticus]
MGLFIIVLLSIATVLLIRNMNKRLRRLPDSFPDDEAARRKSEIARLEADLDRPAADRSPTVDEGSRAGDSAPDPGVGMQRTGGSDGAGEGTATTDRD